jgi:hypothetical protein
LILEREHNFHLGWFITYHKMNFVVLCEYINENLEKGLIWHSKSLVSAPILLVKKEDGYLLMCVDYRGLNWLTIKNQHPLPLISRLFDQVSHAKVYTKIDLRGEYNLVCIWKGDEWKMTFRTHYGHFEHVMMLFSLTNTLVIFQNLMNDVFREYLDDFVVCYINDILIFSKNMADHKHHVHLMLEKLWEVKFYVKLEKCEFHQFQVKFLGYIIFGDGICMDPHKV